jgi:hypothetical protein
MLVPYKRYDSRSIETVIASDNSIAVSADESTLRRWKTWFYDIICYIIGCLESISFQNDTNFVEDKYDPHMSLLQSIWRYVGDANGWLARIVRPIANNNFWVHTRSAFLSRNKGCKLMLNQK